MKLNAAFTPEEQERLLKAPHILADFFKRAGDVGFTVAAEQIRSTYWEIETHATRLRRMAKGWQSAEMGMVQVGTEAQKVLEAAADELDRLKKFSVRRPISELDFTDKWVMLWGPSGYTTTHWRCGVGRLEGGTGRLVMHDGRQFADSGPPATHFSELIK